MISFFSFFDEKKSKRYFRHDYAVKLCATLKLKMQENNQKENCSEKS